jgi:hypothetical protein
MKLYQAAARWRRNTLTGQPEEPWLRAQGVKRPERMVAMLAPGFE